MPNKVPWKPQTKATLALINPLLDTMEIDRQGESAELRLELYHYLKEVLEQTGTGFTMGDLATLALGFQRGYQACQSNARFKSRNG